MTREQKLERDINKLIEDYVRGDQDNLGAAIEILQRLADDWAENFRGPPAKHAI